MSTVFRTGRNSSDDPRFWKMDEMMGLVEKSGDGKGVLTTSIILGMMILPTIIGTTESAMRAVPEQYYEGALALGATHERSILP